MSNQPDRLLPESATTENLRRIWENLPDSSHSNHVKLFFTLALYPFYDKVGGPSGFQGIVGHIIFRISDTIPEEERKVMDVYPSSDGSMRIPLEEGGELFPAASLEDWREEWIKHHPKGIPTVAELWPDSSRYLPQFQNPQE